MRGTPFLRFIAHAVLWAGPLATLSGILAYRFWNAFPVLVDAAALAIAACAGLFAWALQQWLRWQPATCIAAVWCALLVVFAGPLPVLATMVLACAALGIGSWLLPESIASPWARAAVAALCGMAVLAGVTGWLLPIPIHQWFAPALVAIAALARWKSIRNLLAPLPAAWRESIAGSPRLATFALVLLGLAATACWLPTLQFDDLTGHLGLSSQLLHLGYDRMDVASNVWAVAPWAGDTLQAIVQLIAHTESRGALDALWLLMSAALLWELGDDCGLDHAFRWLLVALFVSLPMVAMLAGGMQTEAPAAAVMLALALVVARAPEVPDGRVLCCAAALAGLLCGLKIMHAVAIVPMFVWLVWRWRGRFAWRALPGALAIGAGVGGSSYAYAAWLTGNPLFPLFNDRFRSPDFPPVAFIDARWLAGLHYDLPWQMTFATDRYGEHYPGAAGFGWVALGGALLIALSGTRPAVRALAASGLFMVLVPLSQMQYLRYTHPGVVLLLPALVAAVASTASRRAAFALLVGLSCLDFALQPNTIGILHSGAVARRVLFGWDQTVDRLAPERHFAALLAARPSSEHALFTGNPFVAETAGRAFTTAWYDPNLQAAATAADRDPSGVAWRQLFANIGVVWVETAPSQTSPALASALSDAKATATLGDARWWRLPLPAAAGHDLMAQRDRSVWFVPRPLRHPVPVAPVRTGP